MRYIEAEIIIADVIIIITITIDVEDDDEDDGGGEEAENWLMPPLLKMKS